MLAMKSGMLNRFFASSGHIRFNARDIQAFSKLQEIEGIECAMKKLILGSAAWILDGLTSGSIMEIEQEYCDYEELLNYNLANQFDQNMDFVSPYEIMMEIDDTVFM